MRCWCFILEKKKIRKTLWGVHSPPPLYLRRQFSKSLKIQSDFLLNLKRKYRGLKTENKPWRKDVCWLVCPSSSQGKIPSSHQTKLENSRSSVCKHVLTRSHLQAAITHGLQWNRRKILQQQWLVKEMQGQYSAVPLKSSCTSLKHVSSGPARTDSAFPVDFTSLLNSLRTVVNFLLLFWINFKRSQFIRWKLIA